MTGLSYRAYDVLTGAPLFGAGLPLSGVQFSTHLTEAGTLSAQVAVEPAQREALRRATQPDRAGIYVFDPSGRIVWPGVVVARPWNHREQTLSLEVAHAKAWLNSRLVRKEEGGEHVTWSWRGVDQLQIVRDLVTFAASEPGCPTIRVGTQTSGRSRDLTCEAQSFRTVFDVIDSMANRADGFDWDISAHLEDGRPVWVLELWYPERSQARGRLLLEATPTGGNLLDYGYDEDATDHLTRVWALGDGQPPEALMRMDADPGLSASHVLLRETSTSHQGVTQAATLSDHARASRLASAEIPPTIQVDVTAESPPLHSYDVGDRARLILRDTWLEVDMPSVRIAERTVHDTTRGDTARATLTLNVADHHPPDDPDEEEP